MPTGRKYPVTPSSSRGAPRDKEKLIRQLSLVAYLMARPGRPVKAEDIRRFVEGYTEQTQDAFTRRFHADRDDLAHLGIQIESQSDDTGDGTIYLLPAENFFLPSVPFSREELATLHTCLYLLEGQFAYDHVLRVALQSLALGSGNTLDDPVTSCVRVDMPSSGSDSEVAARQKKIEDAVSGHKSIRFDYHSFSSDTVEQRDVDPYSMMYTHGDWYLVGYSHERGATRIFKLRRIRGRIGYTSKKDHDFSVPADFDIHDYLGLEPWQLGAPKGVAEISFSPRRGWWAANNLSGSGDIELKEDGSAVLRTPYADAGQLCSLVLGKSEDASLNGPPELRTAIAAILKSIASQHGGPAPEPAAPLDPQPESYAGSNSGSGQPQVEPDRFAQLATTVSYLVDRMDGRGEAELDVDEVCHDLGFERPDLEQAIDLLQLICVGDGGGYLVYGNVEGDKLKVTYESESDLLRRPVRLTPREARALLLAMDLVGGQILPGHSQSLETAREKIIWAAGGLDDLETIPIGETEKEDREICGVLNRGLAERRLVEIEYLSGTSGRLETRTIEPYLVRRAKGRWYLMAWCRKRDGMRTFLFEMVKSARLLDETFEPRELDLDRYLDNPRLPSGKEAPRRAKVLFSPSVARWVHEEHPDTVILEDGSLLGEIPWFNESWILDEVLRYRGEAVIIAPDELRKRLHNHVENLKCHYI